MPGASGALGICDPESGSRPLLHGRRGPARRTAPARPRRRPITFRNRADGAAARRPTARHAPSLAIDPERPVRPPDMTTATKVRLRFAKRGDLRLVSHHDLMRCLERMLRRAQVPMATTQGFNPRPKMTFALALGLGIEALREVVDLELTEPWTPSELLARLEASAPPGFAGSTRGRCRPTPPRPGPGRSPTSCRCRRTAARPPAPRWRPSCRPRAGRRSAAGRIASGHSTCARTSSRPNVADDGVLRFRLAVSPEGSARPEDVLEAISLGDLLDEGAFLTRVERGARRVIGRGPARPGRRGGPQARLPHGFHTDYRTNTDADPRRKSRKETA